MERTASTTLDPTKSDIFNSRFYCDFFDLIKQYEDEFKDFVMDVSGDVNLYTTIMEKILISTNGMSLAELGVATTETKRRVLEAAASSHNDEGSISSGNGLEDEGQDDITPLAGDTPSFRRPPTFPGGFGGGEGGK